MRRMLVKIGCERIAEKLQPLAPPVTVSLVHAAMEAGNGFELAFFETLRVELADLRNAGAEEIHFTGLRESTLILRGTSKWNKHCESPAFRNPRLPPRMGPGARGNEAPEFADHGN
jgi:hypothetical protein